MMERDEFIIQVLSAIDEAEVLTIFFPNLAKALIVDVRRDNDNNEGPLVRVVNQVNSIDERIASLERMRPGLGRVRSIAGIPWTKSIRTLAENGILSHLEQRLRNSGESSFRATEACQAAFQKLQEVEYAQWVEVIKGRNPFYRSLWEAASYI